MKRSVTKKRAKAGAAITKSSSVGLLDVEKARALLRDTHDVDTILEIRDAAKLAATYQKIRGASVDSVNDALEIALRAQRRFGVFLIEEGPKRGGDQKSKSPSGTLIRLADLGVSKKESARCKKLAAAAEDLFEQHIAAVREKGERLTTSGTIAATSEAKDYDGDEWGTPEEYIELEREVLGEIELDPASNDRAQTIVRAATYLTKKEDGLSQTWSGRTHLNPPYSHPLVEQFTAKLLEEHEAGNVEAAIALVNNATDTEWCQSMLVRCDAACLVQSRIPFLDADGKPVRGTRQGQIFFYLGEDVATFESVFADVGAIVRPA